MLKVSDVRARKCTCQLQELTNPLVKNKKLSLNALLYLLCPPPPGLCIGTVCLLVSDIRGGII